MTVRGASGRLRSTRGPSRVFLAGLFAVGLLLMGIGASSATPGARPGYEHTASGTAVSISTVASGFAFSPSSVGPLPTGASVTLTIEQLSTTPHTFTLSRLANYSLPSSASASNLSQFFTTNPPLVNISLNGTVGETHSATVTFSTVGFYEYVCTFAGHFQAGMFGFLGYGVAPPNAQPQTGPGAPVFIIGGTIVGLVILALVLAFVIGKRRGSMHEMPPERLGYAEPPATPPKPPAQIP
ncbi:MAG TPA: cupredoxin domain-containing protein, partial [Thermoplasmata archaeon]|nr:cupredoxin domain-containing protein [Thermoplasmata archaeon]